MAHRFPSVKIFQSISVRQACSGWLTDSHLLKYAPCPPEADRGSGWLTDSHLLKSYGNLFSSALCSGWLTDSHLLKFDRMLIGAI